MHTKMDDNEPAILKRGISHILHKRFYGIFNTGEWAYRDPTDLDNPWKFIGGIASLLALERNSKIIWYSLTLPCGRELYLPKLEGKKLVFIYDEAAKI